jgi:hypothetical protein
LKVTHYGTNNNFSLDQISAFIAGGWEHTGALIQVTYTNLPNAFNTTQSIHLDNTDIRPYTTTFNIGDADLTVGASINNGPTVDRHGKRTPSIAGSGAASISPPTDS